MKTEINKNVSAKFAANDTKGAGIVISGSQGLAPFNESTLSQLKELHFSLAKDFTFPPLPDDNAPPFHAT